MSLHIGTQIFARKSITVWMQAQLTCISGIYTVRKYNGKTCIHIHKPKYLT
jgi:hypothetical protein